VNITPDSFSDVVLFSDPEAAVAHGLKLMDEGADLLDLGAESTRPGSRAGGDAPAVSADEEQVACCRFWKGFSAPVPMRLFRLTPTKPQRRARLWVWELKL